MRQYRQIVRMVMVALLLIAGSAIQRAWATDVTYHILTLPIDPSRYDYHMKDAITGWRLEAVSVTEKGQSKLELPAHYKSPLATGFTYYAAGSVTKYSNSAQTLFDNNNSIKSLLYKINGEDTPLDDTDDATPVAEGTSLSGGTAEYFVVYTYDATNTIAQLDGSVRYNIKTIGYDNGVVKEKGFMALNRGRNNRAAVLPASNIDPDMYSSEDFVKVDLTGTKITDYWSSGDNKNKKELTGSKFFLMFKFVGEDPYNIIIRTAYAKDTTYIEKNDNKTPAEFVYKYYKEASLFGAKNNTKAYIASDEHILYNIKHDASAYPINPTDLEPGAGLGYTSRPGNYHGQSGVMLNSVALLNNSRGTGYLFMATNTNENITSSNSPIYVKEESTCNDLSFKQITTAAATNNLTIEGLYPIKKLTFKVATPFYDPKSPSNNHIISVSDWVADYVVGSTVIESKYLPAALKRKYIEFNGKFYSDPDYAPEHEITYFSQANFDGSEGYQVYVGYELSDDAPKFLAPSTSPVDTTWYELTDEGSVQESGRKIKYDGSSSYKNNGANGEYVKESEFALVGDPYELKVLSRSQRSYVTLSEHDTWEMPNDATEGSFLLRKYKGTGHWSWTVGDVIDLAYGSSSTPSVDKNAHTVTINLTGLAGNKYYGITTGGTGAAQIVSVSPRADNILKETGTSATITVKLAENTSETNKTMTVTIQEYDNSDGSVTSGSASEITITQGTTTTSFAGNTVEYSTTNSTRVKVLDLPKRTYTYHMVDNSGRVAVTASAEQTIFSQLSIASLPGIIVSPYIIGETLTFYEDAYVDGSGRENLTHSIRETPKVAGNIYVTYTTDNLSLKPIKLDDDQEFNVVLNGQYLYYEDGSIHTKLSPGTDAKTDAYLWQLRNGDPYAMQIYNKAGEWVKLATTVGNDVELVFDATRSNAQPFIAKASVQSGVYEVMVATGAGIDASTTYYNIGRTGDDIVGIYDQAHYAHGSDYLKFRLEQSTPYTYFLIDKSNRKLLTLTSQSPDLALPAEYQSPLVGRYHFYKPEYITETEGVYTVDPEAPELSSLSELGEEEHDIYVTYDKNDLVTFGTNSPYMLRFLEPNLYYLEDGNDGLTTSRIQAIYPYCNGDGNLNIYGDDMQKEQMGGGASTRPRWVWYFTSATQDPYHVRIHSRNAITYNGISNHTYLQTYAVHFNQDAEAKKQHIVTGGTLPGVASEIPTEYMVLGSPGAFKLMTTEPVAADLNGDGNTTGSGENERRMVTSLEQYWKTYNMVKLNVLGVSSATDAYSDDADTWVVPTEDDPETPEDESAYRTILANRGWHSYTAYANAVRWNGYNDKTDGHEKKVVEQIEHWYQTFEMHNGAFDIESADIPPVLVLLDLHGWEIMRLPLPTTNYPEGDAELTALRVYDSPMVKEYKFYSNATKATGCHKYTLRMQNDEERDQIKVNGEHYTSTSLGDLPPITATGVKSDGLFNDQYVTYTVKEEYAKSYKYTFSDNGKEDYSESGVASTYMVLMGSRFFRHNDGGSANYLSKPIHEASNPPGGNVYDVILSPSQETVSQKSTNVDDNHDGNVDDINLWYMQPNLNIDIEMGIKWGSSDDITKPEPLSAYGTKKKYKDITGFDPYNIQLENVGKSKFLTTHQTSARLENGILIGGYGGGSTDVTMEDACSYVDIDTVGEGYDHTQLTISNQTFMAVSDANGNMQLMPRFDHTLRVNTVNNSDKSFTTLQPSVNHSKASAAENSSMGTQTVFFVRPQRLEYHIIDNEGTESLRYKRAGDEYPTVTDHFKSPFANNYTYYKGLAAAGKATASSEEEWTAADAAHKRSVSRGNLADWAKLLPDADTYYFRINTSGVITYQKVTVTEGLLAKQIKGALAAEGDLTDVYVRYDYDADADHDADRILEGKWFTVRLADKDLQSSGTVSTEVETLGTGVSLYAGNTTPASDANDKPATVDEDDKKWQWKFLAAPTDSTSDYYVAPDPYAVQLFNREANYADDPIAQPSPMAVGIKVNGADRFALLSHPDGGYALAVAGIKPNPYRYSFLNGKDMTTSVAADTVAEMDFTQKTGILTDGVQVRVNNDVKHNFVYKVVNNAQKLAVSATQSYEDADGNDYAPHLPDSAQTPLLDKEDYSYYGTATGSDGSYEMVPQTLLFTLYGLYDDTVWVRYKDYHIDSTSFKIPNKKAIDGGKVVRDPASVDVSLHINGELPYNIIWENDNMMQSSDGSAISYGESRNLSGENQHVWYITGNDPYALKIKHKGGKYVDGDATLAAEGDAKEFMLLKKAGYDYGILQETGGTNCLSGYGQTMVAGNPTKFIIFGLSVHKLIYHLIIARTCTDAEKASASADQYVDIPYRSVVSGEESTKRIYGTTQRKLDAEYQLGTTLSWGGDSHTYSFDAGAVSIGDDLEVPNVFNRPNCTFDFYIAGIYDGDNVNTELTDLESKYKGLKRDKLMSDEKLIDETVVVHIVYSFNQDLATNNGLDFVKSIDDKCWYTFETSGAGVPYLAHYTNAWGLQSMAGRETRYTNDYLWTPVGDVYGFKLYNRYMIKNSDGSDKVMTFAGEAANNKSLVVAKPGGDYTGGNEIFELLPGDQAGYFRVHPVINKDGDQYYVRRDASDDNYAKLSTTPSDWTFGLSKSLLEPYHQRAGYVGGLTAAGKAAYETAESSGTIMDVQRVVYDDSNIIPFAKGYYRLHSQPGVSGIDPVRYASGYLHETELTTAGGIPMHFYSREGKSTTFAGEDGLKSGFTETNATRGDIPIPATESDPSTIFYLNGAVTNNPTISTATMSTQGLNVLGNQMTTGSGTTFTLIDIGGAVFLIVDELEPMARNYLNFDQTSAIYDLKFAHDAPTDDAKWCLQPVQKTAEAGNGEMPLMLATNNGGDGYYYATFYAPYDVLLPADEGGNTYNAYICKKWYDEGVNPNPVPATGVYGEGKLIPAATPVIIRTNDESESVTLTLPFSSPSDEPLACAFTGSYLEQLLAVDAEHDVYTFGLPLVSDVEKAGDYVTSGDIIAPLPVFDNDEVGFYINATRNKEADEKEALWRRNNRYVLHNKIYYRATASQALAPGRNGSVYVPVLFDEEDEEQPGESRPANTSDGCVYDLLGRKVATIAEMQAGGWPQRLQPGIYIVDGKKIYIQ